MFICKHGACLCVCLPSGPDISLAKVRSDNFLVDLDPHNISCWIKDSAKSYSDQFYRNFHTENINNKPKHSREDLRIYQPCKNQTSKIDFQCFGCVLNCDYRTNIWNKYKKHFSNTRNGLVIFVAIIVIEKYLENLGERKKYNIIR